MGAAKCPVHWWAYHHHISDNTQSYIAITSKSLINCNSHPKSNPLEAHTRLPHPSMLLIKCTQVLEQKQSHGLVLLLPEAGITQTFFPSICFMCTTGNLPDSPVCKSFDWAVPAWPTDSLVLTNQVAFAKCLKIPPPIALSAVFNSSLHCWIFPGGWCAIGCVIST